MKRRANPPPRPIALWAATLVVSLHCGWVIAGGVLRFAQSAFTFSDDWFDRLWLPRVDDLAFTGLLTVTAIGLLAFQTVSVLLRESGTATVVGIVFWIAGIPLLFVTTFCFLAFLDSLIPWYGLLLMSLWTTVLFSTGIVMLRWGSLLARRAPLPPPPVPAEDD